jgi:integrase
MDIKPSKFPSKTTPYRVTEPEGYNGNPKPVAKYFETKSGAMDHCAKVNAWRAAKRSPGFTPDLKFDQTESAMLLSLRENGIKTHAQLSEVLRHWVRTGEAAINQVSLRDAVQKFVSHVETEEKPSAPYLVDIVGKLNRFAAEFPGAKTHEVDRSEVKEYLADWENPATRNQQLKRLSKFFGWAKKERHIAIDPTADIDFAKVEARENIDIYSVEDITKLLQVADTKYKAVAPWFILGAFGFMRSAEIQRLDWSAIDFDKGSITLAASITKTGKRRVVELNDALRHWLTPYKKDSGLVVGTLNGEVAKAFETAGVERKHNALRHSCVSYAAKGSAKGLDDVFMMAGHTPSVSLRHYIESMTEAEAKPYWQIRRQA